MQVKGAIYSGNPIGVFTLWLTNLNKMPVTTRASTKRVMVASNKPNKKAKKTKKPAKQETVVKRETVTKQETTPQAQSSYYQRILDFNKENSKEISGVIEELESKLENAQMNSIDAFNQALRLDKTFKEEKDDSIYQDTWMIAENKKYLDLAFNDLERFMYAKRLYAVYEVYYIYTEEFNNYKNQ